MGKKDTVTKEYISVADREDEFKIVIEDDSYRNIKIETVRLLNECVGTKIPITESEEGEIMEMCKATKAILEEGRLEGRLESLQAFITTLRELGQSDEFIISKIMEKFQMTNDEAKKYVK